MHFCCSSQQGLPLLGALEELLPTDKTMGGGEGRGGEGVGKKVTLEFCKIFLG